MKTSIINGSEVSRLSVAIHYYWEPLLRKQSCQHPIKHLLLCYCLLRTSWPLHVDKKSKSIIIDGNTTQICLLNENHNNVNALAKELNKSRCFIKGIIYKKYIRNYRCNIKINIITEFLIKSMAVRGFSLASIAEKNSLSEGSVSFVISSFHGLCSWRKKCKKDSLRRRHKQKILRFMRGLTGPVTRKLVRASCYASFFWLNKFESQWLDFYLPKEPRLCNAKRVDWRERDKFALSLIKDALAQGQCSLSLSGLDSVLGGHGWLLKHRDKFPVTMALIDKNKSK
ncbi:TnsD family Tn7-like transposition protein [Escherichia coli]|uniref:TnsD family Tn7-like transposition protein n=1 Tax=Escherichia coli TaxID=562 RepID=UPI00207CBA66|nr:TnsD family Tn7-like transposition protein [Escherichia coli]